MARTEMPTSTATPPAPRPSAATIRIYNTLSRTKETLQPVQPGKIGIYLCGPTVYKEAHIGHMVGPVIFDAIKRYLVYNGFDVTWVVNITDVDDKLINEANKRGIAMEQVARENTADYLANLRALGVDQIDHMPKATDSMPEIVRFIERLIEQGFAYTAEGDVFFDVTKDPDYGKLTNRTIDDMQGEGGEAASKKHSAADFALWKAAKPGEPSWKSPWGQGRPGWHIECSAMSRSLLGETFDIHGGGLDLIFPHHENEIAQSECCHGKPMARYWLHNGLLKRGAAGKIGGRSDRADDQGPLTLEQIRQATAEKESRSGGAGGLAQLIARYGGETLRFFLLRTHYRSSVVFGDEAIQEAASSLETFYRFFKRYERIAGHSFYDLPKSQRRDQHQPPRAGDELLEQAHARREEFLAKMDDDFNTGGAVSELFELARTLNKYIDQHGLEEASQRDPQQVQALQCGVAILGELGNLLGLFRSPPEQRSSGDDERVGQLMQLLIELRAEARKRKDFATADRVRDGLGALHIVLEDRKEGTEWRKET